MAVNTAVITSIGSGRIYESDDGKLKWAYVDIALAINVTYDTSLRVDMTGFKAFYPFHMQATAGETGKEVKIKQIELLSPFAISAGATGQVKGTWAGMKNFQIVLSIIGSNGNTATTGPKDEAELGAVSTGSPAGHAHAIVYF